MIKKIKRWIHKIKASLKMINIANKSEYILVLRQSSQEDGFRDGNRLIIPYANIDYLFTGYIYDDESHKYKIRKTIVLKSGSKHKIYDGDSVVDCDKKYIFDLLNRKC